MAHLVAALQSAELEVDAAVLESLSTAPAAAALTPLVNDLARAGEQQPGKQWIVVLDDYHAIGASEVHEAVTFLLDHLPDHLHLVMATRSDPPLPLARLRSRGQLSELRAADLRFTPAEARQFLNQVMGLELTEADVDALEDRTEGWIAGLQLAALSLRGIADRNEVADFIQAFTGSNRFVIDYLADEVLARQPRRFATSCSVPPSSTDSTARYATPSPAAPTVRGRWRTSNGETSSSSRSTPSAPGTATTTCSPTYSTRVCSPSSPTRSQNSMSAPAPGSPLAAWSRTRSGTRSPPRISIVPLPDGGGAAADTPHPAGRPAADLGAVLAGASGAPKPGPLHPVQLVAADVRRPRRGRIAARRRRSGTGRRGPGPELAARWADTDDLRTAPATVSVYRASLAQARGDVAGTVRHARHVLDLAGPTDHFLRGAGGGYLGLAAWASGNVAEALSTFSDAVRSLHAAGNFVDELDATVVLGDMWVASGRPGRARRLYEQALQTATAGGPPYPRATADLHVGLAELDRELDDLPSAEAHLESARVLGERASITENRHRWYVVMAQVCAARGDYDTGTHLLGQAEALYRHGFYPDVRPIAALKARIQIAAGDLSSAGAWAEDRGISVDEKPDYLREYEHLTLARLLLAQHRAGQPVNGAAGAAGR